jgi:WD40 repeat protein
VATAAAVATVATLALAAGPRVVTTLGGPIASVAFSPDGHTLATGQAYTVRLWHLDDAARLTLEYTLTGQTVTGTAMAFSPNGHLLAAANASSVKVWDVADPTRPVFESAPPGSGTASPLLGGRTGSASPVRAVAFSPDGRTLAAGIADGTVRLWSITDPGSPVVDATLAGFSSAVTAVAFLASPARLVAAANDSIGLWGVSDPTHPQPVHSLLDAGAAQALSPAGRTVVTADGSATSVWNITGAAWTAAKIVDPSYAVSVLAYDPTGGGFAAYGSDHAIRLWGLADPAHPALRATLPETGTPSTLEFSPSGRLLAAAGAYGLELWDVGGV